MADAAQQEAHQQQDDDQQRRTDDKRGGGGHLADQGQRHRHGDGVGGRLGRDVGVNDLHSGDDALILRHAVHMHGVGLGGNAVLCRAGDGHHGVALLGQLGAGLGDVQGLLVLCHAGQGGSLGLIGDIGHIFRHCAGEGGTECANVQRQLLQHGVGAGLVVGILLARYGDGVILLGAGGGGAGNGHRIGAHHQRIAADRDLGGALRRLIAEIQGLHRIGHGGRIIGGIFAEGRAQRGVGAGEGAEVAVAAERRVHLAAPCGGADVGLVVAVGHGDVLEAGAQGRSRRQIALDPEGHGQHIGAGVNGIGHVVQQEAVAVDHHGPAADLLIVVGELQHAAVIAQRGVHTHDAAAGNAELQRHGELGVACRVPLLPLSAAEAASARCGSNMSSSASIKTSVLMIRLFFMMQPSSCVSRFYRCCPCPPRCGRP